MNKNSLIFTILFNTFCWMIPGAYASEIQSDDPVAPEMKVMIANVFTDKIFDTTALILQSNNLSNEQIKAHFDNNRVMRGTLFNCRLVSQEWKDAVDEHIKTKTVFQIRLSLSPEKAKDVVVSRLASLTQSLSFKGWNLENCDQINHVISTNDFSNLVSLKLETSVNFNLLEIVKKCPKITELFLEGTQDINMNPVGNTDLPLVLVRLKQENHPKNLRVLSLAANNLNDRIILYFNAFTHWGNFQKLEELDLSFNKITPEGLKLFDCLHAEQLPCFKVLKLCNNPLLKSDNLVSENAIFNIAKKFSTLTKIYTQNCWMNEAFFSMVNANLGKKIISYEKWDVLNADNRTFANRLGLTYVESESEDSASDDDSDDGDCVIQ